MTAELAVMNKGAIALAADSAVTVGGRVYQSVNKLFMLSKIAPVGVMVYNAGSIMGLPAETVIKAFRKNLGTTLFDTLEEYKEALLGFLRSDTVIFTSEMREEHLKSLVRHKCEQLQKKVFAALYQEYYGKKPNKRRIESAARKVVEDAWDEISKAGLVTSAKKSQLPNLRRQVSQWANEFSKIVFGTINVSARTKSRLGKLCAEFLAKDVHVDDYTGIVIAGFGENDFVPALSEVRFTISMPGFERVVRKEKVDLDKTFGAHVLGFAQDDMVRTFLTGVAPDYQYFVNDAVRKGFSDIQKKLSSAPGATQGQRTTIAQGFGAMCDIILEGVREAERIYKVEKHMMPTFAAIGSLPKEDLASLAESLVSLTSLKRKVTSELETVGGPVDVALITKGDGFVWIKRKHYFKPELNPHFSQN